MDRCERTVRVYYCFYFNLAIGTRFLDLVINKVLLASTIPIPNPITNPNPPLFSLEELDSTPAFATN